MPSAETFSIKPIADLLNRLPLGSCVVDPFARNSRYAHVWSNDLSPAANARFQMDAEDFAELLIAEGVKATAILFDPPYSLRQVKEVYQGVGKPFGKDESQQAIRWSRLKDKLSKCCAPGCLVISFGWNSTGFGKSRGFVPVEYLIVNHGAAHNDTICTVERFVGLEQ